jgi:hypothetical protein
LRLRGAAKGEALDASLMTIFYLQSGVPNQNRKTPEDTMFGWPLTPPKQVTLLVSLILAIFACLVHWLHVAVPPLSSGFVFLVLGYVVLLAGNVFRDV